MSVVTKAALKAKFETGDFPTQQDFSDFVDTVYPYEKYVALLTQSGTAAPVATVLENTLGGTVVWSYDGVGEYLGTLIGAFPLGKTLVFISPKEGNDIQVGGSRQSNDVIYLSTSNGASAYTNGRLGTSNDPTSIEIRVYP